MRNRKNWLSGIVAFGVVLGAGVGEAASEELTRVQSKALERLAMQSGLGDGMWTHYVPKDVQGEFDSYDPIGLIAGDLIKSDCSVSWQDEDGHLYCFASAASLVHFRDWPRANADKARAAWKDLAQAQPGF